jgi:hypothetical protein
MSTSNIVPLPLTSTPAPVSAPTTREIGTLLARLRRDTRQAVAGIERAEDEAQRIRSEVQALKDAGDAVYAERIQTLERRADQLEAHHGPLEEVIRECGYALMGAAPMIDSCTTLAQRCALLNINVADRAGLTEIDGLASLVFDHGKEDSAACRHCEFKEGPLFRAVHRVFMDFLMTRDEQPGGRYTFSPGGLFFDSLCNPLPAQAARTATFH